MRCISTEFILFLFFLLLCLNISAQATDRSIVFSSEADKEEGWGESEDEGWGDENKIVSEENGYDTNTEKISFSLPKPNLPFQGFLRQTVAHHLTDKSSPKDFSSVQMAVEIEYDKRFLDDFRFHFVGQGFYDFVYLIEGRNKYSDEELDELESGGKLKECWISWRKEMFDIYAGRQIVVWGESDGLAITDLINPRDQSLFFYQNLEDSRLGVGMLRFNYYWGNNTLSLITIGEFRPNRLSIEGSEFDFRPIILEEFNILPFEVKIGDHQSPGISSQPEWGIRLMMPGEGYDISFMAASLFDDDFVFSVGDSNFSTDTGLLDKVTLDLLHKRFDMIGFTANKMLDKFIFKIEFAYYHDKSFNVINEQLLLDLDPGSGMPSFLSDQKLTDELILIENRNVINIAAGFDYAYSDKLTILFNQQFQKILDFDERLLANEETYITFVNFSFSFLNDALNPGYTIFYFAEDKDFVHKLNIYYETTMGFNIGAGVDVVATPDSDSSVGVFKDTSRFWAEVKCSF